MEIVSVIVFKNILFNASFRGLSNDKIYFSAAQIFVDFVIFTYSGDCGKVKKEMKKLTLKWFLVTFRPLIFFKLICFSLKLW